MGSFSETARRFPKPGSCLSPRRGRSEAEKAAGLDGHKGRSPYPARVAKRLRDSTRGARARSGAGLQSEKRRRRQADALEHSGRGSAGTGSGGELNHRDKRRFSRKQRDRFIRLVKARGVEALVQVARLDCRQPTGINERIGHIEALHLRHAACGIPDKGHALFELRQLLRPALSLLLQGEKGLV